MSGHYRKEKNCLNCGHHVEEHYCTHCGQPNLELKEPFWHFIGHSIGHYFHFDSKFFHTLVPLLSKPGQITLDYLAGKRARYIHPVSLYIFVSIVYFIVVPHSLKEKKVKTELTSAQKDSATVAVRKSKAQLNSIAPGLGNSIRLSLDTDSQFNALNRESQVRYIDSLEKVMKAKPNEGLQNQIDDYKDLISENQDTSYSAYLARQQKLPADERDSWLEKKAQKLKYDKRTKKLKKGEHADSSEHKVDIEEEVKKYQPKQYFLLMPLLALFIMINFRKNRIYYIDHLVFTIHGMTAYFIVSIVTQPIEKYIFGLGSFMSEAIELIVFAGIVWYLYSGLKLFYQRSRNVTIRKTITVMFMYTLTFYISEEIIRQIVIMMMT
ncbi:DUF3667 domain-containing protein [Pedobacter sp. MC2016-15]|uniref:DUF3667 domain-containing protein n=1 Tax=Pedobacter sp. MC2016-15 TaxID=2994473 RepID=UPI002246DB9C|nr:DUF3667 domain-containing protein [Pedobacter sp. MC2016-15]MCX2477591.1 DUF3667 domain-containing protein [Pedobacter sp. MC2016-15]